MTMTPEPAAESVGGLAPDRAVQSTRSRPPKLALRYSAKIARRELRSRPWRAMSVVLLIAVPMWTMVNLTMAVRTLNEALRSPGADFSSDLVIPFIDPLPTSSTRSAAANRNQSYAWTSGAWTSGAMTSAEIEEVLPPGSTVQRTIGGNTSIMTDGGAIESATFLKIDLTTDAAASWAPLSKGRPAGPGEVVLGDELASRLGADVGDSVILRQPPGDWRVAGITSWSESDLFAVQDFDESELTVTSGQLLVNLPHDSDPDDAGVSALIPEGSRFSSVKSGDGNDFERASFVWLVAILVFTMFGVVIVAAFATIARSQLVTVGQLAANGANSRFTRQMLAMQGFWTGLIGVAIGAAATVVTVPFVKPLIANIPTVPLRRVEWNPIDVVIVALIGVAVATAAAAIPARALTKTSALDALAGQRRQTPVPKWLAPLGLVSFGLGLVVVVTAWNSTNSSAGAIWACGVFFAVIGICLCSPLGIDAASRVAGVMPLSGRISLRGLGRTRLRSAAVVSSIAVTTGIISIVVAGIETNTRGPQPGHVAENVAFVGALPSLEVRTLDGEAVIDDDGRRLVDLPDGMNALELRWVPAVTSQVEEVRSVLPDATERGLRVAVRPDGVYDERVAVLVSNLTGYQSRTLPGDRAIPSGDGIVREFDSLPLVADDATLAGFSLPDTFADDLDRVGYAMAIGDEDPFDCGGWETANWGADPFATHIRGTTAFVPGAIDVIEVPGIECDRFVGPFMTERFARDHGYQIEPAGTLFINPDPLTTAERDRLTSDFQYPSLFADWDYTPDGTHGQRPAAASSVQAYSRSSIAPGTNVYRPALAAEEYSRLQLVTASVALLIITLITALGLALAASDSRRDRAVLNAIGARPGTQSQIAAWDAWVLVVIGTVLGVPAGLFAARMVTSDQQTPTGVPWLFVAAELVLVPLVVAGIAWGVTRLRPKTPPMRVLHAD